jgi:hypothetical protein
VKITLHIYIVNIGKKEKEKKNGRQKGKELIGIGLTLCGTH